MSFHELQRSALISQIVNMSNLTPSVFLLFVPVPSFGTLRSGPEITSRSRKTEGISRWPLSERHGGPLDLELIPRFIAFAIVAIQAELDPVYCCHFWIIYSASGDLVAAYIMAGNYTIVPVEYKGPFLSFCVELNETLLSIANNLGWIIESYNKSVSK